jgi:peptide/nickel transport system ATP-binding protein
MSAVLSVQGLHTAFRVDGEWRTVVRDLSFEIGQGESLAVVGESGSGKSVTALSIMRLIPEVNGRIQGAIHLGGRDLLQLDEPAMRAVRGAAISMIFQEPMTSLNPVLTIGFQIAETLRFHQSMDRTAARAEALRILDRVRIPDAPRRFDEYPHRFSGGMRQRVMIAMALACRPQLLIADEPTTALDVTIQAQILGLIRELQTELGMSVLFITHDMGVVAEVADRMVVMLKGESVEQGSTAAVFAQPRHPYTRSLLGAVPVLGSLTGQALPRRFPQIDEQTGHLLSDGQSGRTPALDAPPLLSVRNLVTRFDIRAGLLGRVAARVHAVENVSFDIRPGETLALVGESGCGKSTTGRSLLRLLKPNSGKVEFEGMALDRLSPQALQRARQNMQMIFQDPYASLNPRRRIGDSIMEPLRVHGKVISRSEADDRVAGLLKRVGLSPDMADRFPHEFSGGQRQRICIARALGLEPRLIIADEAVSALDVSIKAQVINLMLDLQDELGLAYLFISHDMAVVERMCHRVAVMRLGEIVEMGPRDAVFSNPIHPYTRKLLAAVPIPDPARKRARAALDVSELPSPMRPHDYQPPARTYREVSPGHQVMIDA